MRSAAIGVAVAHSPAPRLADTHFKWVAYSDPTHTAQAVLLLRRLPASVHGRFKQLMHNLTLAERAGDAAECATLLHGVRELLGPFTPRLFTPRLLTPRLFRERREHARQQTNRPYGG